jgi:hypothetical protein
MGIVLNNAIPKIWEAKILRDLEKTLVGRKICTAPISGEIKNFGDTVYFPSLADPAVADYTGSITYEELSDAKIGLQINQQKSFAFKIDSIDAAQAVTEVKGGQLDRAIYKLRDAADQYIFSLYAQAGTSLSSSAVTSATILSRIARLGRVLDEANVTGQKWIAISPSVKERMILAGIKFQMEDGGAGVGLEFANYLDFTVYVTNNLNKSGSGDTQVFDVMAGSSNAIVFAEQVMQTRMMELEGSFKVGCSGLMTYGASVIKPKELVVDRMTLAAETAI